MIIPILQMRKQRHVAQGFTASNRPSSFHLGAGGEYSGAQDYTCYYCTILPSYL